MEKKDYFSVGKKVPTDEDNLYYPRLTPLWQKPITFFFNKKISEDNCMYEESIPNIEENVPQHSHPVEVQEIKKQKWSEQQSCSAVETNDKEKIIQSPNEIQKKEVSSVGTMTENLNVPEALDFSKIPEIGSHCKSTSHSKSDEHYHLSDDPSYCALNNSDAIPCKQSTICAELEETIPYPEKISEDFPWEIYEIQQRVELDVSLTKQNKNLLSNLILEVFLDELKKLNKYKSFQKVLHVFDKWQTDIDGKNSSNWLDVKELLKMIIQYICVDSLNTEITYAIYRYKEDLEKLKIELKELSEKYELDLKKQKREINTTKVAMTRTCEHVLLTKDSEADKWYKKCELLFMNMIDLRKKCALKQSTIQTLEKRIKDLDSTVQLVKQHSVGQIYRNKISEKMCKSLREENNHLKEEIEKVKEEIKMLLKEEEENEKKEKSVASAVSKYIKKNGRKRHSSCSPEVDSETASTSSCEKDQEKVVEKKNSCKKVILQML